ncbi:MAG: hypothetical protein ABI947_22050 [Chloroflexota bacterium]
MVRFRPVSLRLLTCRLALARQHSAICRALVAKAFFTPHSTPGTSLSRRLSASIAKRWPPGFAFGMTRLSRK